MSRAFRVGRCAALGLFALSAAGLASCQPVVPPVPLPVPTPTPTTTPVVPPVGSACASSSASIVCTQLTVDGLQRKIFTHVSSAPAPATGRPVVLFFHGDGGTANVNLSSLYAQTDPDGALVIQLDGPNNIASLGRGGTAWSFFMNGSTPDDVNFTKTVVDDVLNGSLIPGANANPKRVYAIGASRGAFMVDTLLVDARTAAYFPAVVNVSGNFYCEDGDAVCAARINADGFHASGSILHIHGDADFAVDAPAKVPTPVTSTISWPWPMAQFSYANGCSGDFAYASQLSPAIGGKPTYLYKPAGGCGLDFQLVLIKGGGHVPSGWESHSWNYLKTKTKP